METEDRRHRLVAVSTPPIAALVAAVLIAGTQATSPRQSFDDLLNADRAFSTQGADRPVIESIPRMFGADVIVPAPGNRFAEGREQAIEAMRANADNLTAKATWSPAGGGISSDGQHGFTFGYMTARRADGTVVPLKYLAYWIKQQDGWRIAAYRRRQRAAGEALTPAMPPSLPERIVPVTSPASPEVVEGLKKVEKEFSDTAQRIGIGEAFAKFGHENAVNMGPPNITEFVVGAEAIGRSVSTGVKPGTSPVFWSADRAIVSPGGDLGITFGMIRSNDKPQEPGAPFFTIWRRAAASLPWRYIAE